MSITEKILLLNEIKRNYNSLKKYWKAEKIEWLESQILIELENLGNFNLDQK